MIFPALDGGVCILLHQGNSLSTKQIKRLPWPAQRITSFRSTLSINLKQRRRDMLQALKEDDAAILKELDVVRQYCCTASSVNF